jgi:hypothetical protein
MSYLFSIIIINNPAASSGALNPKGFNGKKHPAPERDGTLKSVLM